MELVVDANILFSFFKKDSTTRELILHLKDVPYVALSLSIKGKGHDIGLWSNEKRLKKLEKHGIKVFSTSDLISFFSQT